LSKTLGLFLALLAGLVSVSANAAEMKVGFISIPRVLNEAAPAVKASKKLEKEFSAREQEVKKMGKQLKDLQTSLDREGAAMGETERKNKERDLTNLSRDFSRAEREYREDLNIRKNEEFSAIQDRIRKVILSVAKEEGFDLIVQDAVYVSPKVDITDKIIKALADK
jgi:outer membrane protein